MEQSKESVQLFHTFFYDVIFCKYTKTSEKRKKQYFDAMMPV